MFGRFGRKQMKNINTNVKHQSEQGQVADLPPKKIASDRKSFDPTKRYKTRANKGGLIDLVIEKIIHEKKRATVQDTVPYDIMWENGICKNSEGYYTKMISFEDTNYKLASEDGCDRVFKAFSDLLNYFTPDIRVQFCYTNTLGRMEAEQGAISIKRTETNQAAAEYQEMLTEQLLKGSNGLKRNRYMVYGVRAKSVTDAGITLDRLELDVLHKFKRMGVLAESLTGYERLQVLHHMLHPDHEQKFIFKWKECTVYGKSSKDYIVPDCFEFPRKSGSYFCIDQYKAAASYIEILASELPDDLLMNLLELESNQTISLHIRPIDQVNAIKMVRVKKSEVEANIIDIQKKAVRSGYNPDFIPSNLEEYRDDLKQLIKELQKRDEKLFSVTITILNIERNKKLLEEVLAKQAAKCSQNNCIFRRLYYQQEQGLHSALPLAVKAISSGRILTTSATASFIPFSTEELFMQDSQALYYGLNPLSHNMIMATRKKLSTPNGLYLGTPGSGKSFAAKREIVNNFLITDDDIIISDPESEYGNMVRYLGGEVIKISSASKNYLNPLDLNMRYGDDESPLKYKSSFVLSLVELVQGGITAIERSIIDRCLPRIYAKYFAHPDPQNLPILQDLYEELQTQGEDGVRIAQALEIYVTGSLNVFNHHTNVDLNKRLICFDIKDLGKQLNKIGMLIVNDQVWNKVTSNREDGRYTWYYEDEFHLKFKDPLTAQHSAEMWKRFRKWGAIPTGITQNVKEMLGSTEIETIFENTDFLVMLNQGPEGKRYLSEALALSEQQEAYITNSEPGQGLMFFRPVIIPVIDHFPKHTKLYQMMTTKFNEVSTEL